jgi:hypothetical protein
MLSLRRRSIGYSEREGKNIFTQLSLDTEDAGYLSSWARFLKGEIIIQKTWIGKVDKGKNEFRILRTKAGIFKTGISTIEIYGRLTDDKNKKTIEIKMRPTWTMVIALLGLTVFLTAITWNYFNDIVGWILVSVLLAFQISLFIADLNKTDETLTEYLALTGSETETTNH